jgi:hypothetical protein
MHDRPNCLTVLAHSTRRKDYIENTIPTIVIWWKNMKRRTKRGGNVKEIERKRKDKGKI